MDAVSYNGFQERLAYLENLLEPSFGATPVLQQLEKLDKLVHKATSDDANRLFRALKTSYLWNQLPTLKSGVGREYDVEEGRNMILASHTRMMKFMKDFEEVVRLAEETNKLIQSTSPNYKKLLSLQLPRSEAEQLVGIYSTLLVRSMALLERNFEFMMRENQYWSELESKLVSMERNIDSLLREKVRENQYS